MKRLNIAPSTRDLLFYYCARADRDTGTTNVSPQRAAQDLELRKDHVDEHDRRLIRGGFIIVSKDEFGGRIVKLQAPWQSRAELAQTNEKKAGSQVLGNSPKLRAAPSQNLGSPLDESPKLGDDLQNPESNPVSLSVVSTTTSQVLGNEESAQIAEIPTTSQVLGKSPQVLGKRSPKLGGAIRNNQTMNQTMNQNAADAGANAPPATVPPEPPDTNTIIWQRGVAILTAGGVAAGQARSLLGKLAKDYGKETLAQAIETVEGANPASPREYLVKVLQNLQKGGKANDWTEERNRRARRDLARFRTDWKAKWREQHGGGAKVGA